MTFEEKLAAQGRKMDDLKAKLDEAVELRKEANKKNREEIAAERCASMVGKIEKVLVEEKAKKGGLLCGTALTVASLLQQFGIDRGTSSGKAGFITALYILLVPIFSVVLRKRIRPIIWPCAAMAVFIASASF